MSRAKHRGKIAMNEFHAFVKKVERATAHETLLLQHRAHKGDQKAIAELKRREQVVDANPVVTEEVVNEQEVVVAS